MSRPLAAALLLALTGAAAGGPPQMHGGCAGSHIVVRGDTLYSIARRCRSSVAAIAQASGLADPRRIEIGQRLVIPGGAAAAEPLAYRIQSADTLYSLARWSRVRLSALIAANPGIDPRRIEIGDAVRLPAGAADPAPARERERGRAGAPPRPASPRDVEDDDKPEAEPDPAGM